MFLYFSWHLWVVWFCCLTNFQKFSPLLVTGTTHLLVIFLCGQCLFSPAGFSTSDHLLIVTVLRTLTITLCTLHFIPFPGAIPTTLKYQCSMMTFVFVSPGMTFLFWATNQYFSTDTGVALPWWLIGTINCIYSKLITYLSDSDTQVKNHRIRHFLPFV